MMSTLSQQVREAREFADQTTRTIRTACESAPDCIVDESTKGNVWRATIAPPNNKPAPLTVNGAQILKLLVNYECPSPPRHSHMLIETSRFILLPKDANEPLMRMEYMRHPRSSIPSFHMHMHAHRDAWTFTMCRDGVGSSRKKVYQRGSTKRVPQLSDIHIPVGGPRLRPALEDLLEMLIHDLGVDHADDALKVLEEQRVRWRVTQVQAIAKSMPNIVADALRDEGYKVISPADSESTNQPPPWVHRY